MKYACFVLAVVMAAGLLGGCSPKVVSAEDFLYTYRTGALPDEPVAPGAADYVGRQGDFQVIQVRGGSPSQAMMNVNGRVLKCRAEQLPADFPRGFQPLRGAEAFESSEDTREYVREYLQRQTPSPQKSPAAKDSDDWSEAR